MVPGSEPFGQLRRRQNYDGVPLMRWQQVLIGLLIASTFIGSIGVALRSSFLTATQLPAFTKIQDRLIAVADPATVRSVSLQTSEQSDSTPRVSVAEVDAFSVDNIHPTVGDEEQGELMPKPMAFGSIGYNYNPQR